MLLAVISLSVPCHCQRNQHINHGIAFLPNLKENTTQTGDSYLHLSATSSRPAHNHKPAGDLRHALAIASHHLRQGRGRLTTVKPDPTCCAICQPLVRHHQQIRQINTVCKFFPACIPNRDLYQVNALRTATRVSIRELVTHLDANNHSCSLILLGGHVPNRPNSVEASRRCEQYGIPGDRLERPAVNLCF